MAGVDSTAGRDHARTTPYSPLGRVRRGQLELRRCDVDLGPNIRDVYTAVGRTSRPYQVRRPGIVATGLFHVLRHAPVALALGPGDRDDC